MKIVSVLIITGLATLFSNTVTATTFTPKFSNYPFFGTQSDVDGAANTFFSTSYGLTVDNAYLYKDSRDTFDQIGIASGFLNTSGNQTGRVNFLDLTDFVTLEYWSLIDSTYKAFTKDGTLISSVFKGKDDIGTLTFDGGSSLIGYITFSSTVNHFSTISGLTYNYDGTTGGGNTDINPVPIPAALPLMGSALGLFAFGLNRKKSKTI